MSMNLINISLLSVKFLFKFDPRLNAYGCLDLATLMPFKLLPDIFMTVIKCKLLAKKLPSSARVLVNLLDGEVLLSDTFCWLLLL